MSRSNSRSGTGRRKTGADVALPPLLLDETVTQPARGKKSQLLKSGPAGEPDVMPDVDAMLDKQAARDMQENGIARRRIEMLRGHAGCNSSSPKATIRNHLGQRVADPGLALLQPGCLAG